jgi:hypothetical protein
MLDRPDRPSHISFGAGRDRVPGAAGAGSRDLTPLRTRPIAPMRGGDQHVQSVTVICVIAHSLCAAAGVRRRITAMTAAEPSPTRGRGRPGRGGRGGGRLRAALLAVAALLITPSTAAAADEHRHTLTNRIVDSDGRTWVHLSGTLTFYKADIGKYRTDFWIHNGAVSSSSVYFKFHYENGTVATSRTWGNPEGTKTSLNHRAWIGYADNTTEVPRIRFITVVLSAAGRTNTCHYPNKLVTDDYGTEPQCGIPSPRRVETRGIRITPPMTNPSPAPGTQPAAPLPPVVMPGPAPVTLPRSPRGCTRSDQPIVAKLRMQRRTGRTVPRILAVAYWAKLLPAVQQPRRRDLRRLGRLKVARGKPFRVSLANGFAPGARVRVYARVRYRWRGERKVHVRTTRRVVRICL